MSDVVVKLLDQGVLGIVVVLLVGAVVHLYRENQRLRDRYEAARDKQNEKLQILADSVNRVLDRFGRRGGPT